IAELLDRLAREPVSDPGGFPLSNGMEMESQMAAFNMDAIEDQDRPGQHSGFACPDCGGTLWELTEGDLIRFRCRVGHAWSSNGLVAEQSEGIETALWTGPATTGRRRTIRMHDPAGPSPPTDLVALVASAGGLAALTAVLSHLPADFPAA